MELNQTVRDVLEIGIGLVYLVGAIFNSAYTFRHGNEFYGGFAEGAWFAPSRKFVRNVVIPRSKVFTSLLIIFQLLVAFAILTRGPYVVYGLYAGVIFNLGAAVVSSIAGTLVNLVLAAVQFLLASLIRLSSNNRTP
jgi:hypothetical protein